MTTQRMKVMNFLLGTEKLKYKFPSDASVNLIDSALRREFNLLRDINYSLIDMNDNAVVDLSSLIYLDDQSNIIINIKDMNKSINNSISAEWAIVFQEKLIMTIIVLEVIHHQFINQLILEIILMVVY